RRHGAGARCRRGLLWQLARHRSAERDRGARARPLRRQRRTRERNHSRRGFRNGRARQDLRSRDIRRRRPRLPSPAERSGRRQPRGDTAGLAAHARILPRASWWLASLPAGRAAARWQPLGRTLAATPALMSPPVPYRRYASPYASGRSGTPVCVTGRGSGAHGGITMSISGRPIAGSGAGWITTVLGALILLAAS